MKINTWKMPKSGCEPIISQFESGKFRIYDGPNNKFEKANPIMAKKNMNFLDKFSQV